MKLTVAFDCDDTLVVWSDTGRFMPNHNVIDLMRWFQRNGHRVIVWSGGGIPYAMDWVEKFNLYFLGDAPEVVEKGSIPVDIAIDDMGGADETARYYEELTMKCAKVTIRVGRD